MSRRQDGMLNEPFFLVAKTPSWKTTEDENEVSNILKKNLTGWRVG